MPQSKKKGPDRRDKKNRAFKATKAPVPNWAKDYELQDMKRHSAGRIGPGYVQVQHS